MVEYEFEPDTKEEVLQVGLRCRQKRHIPLKLSLQLDPERPVCSCCFFSPLCEHALDARGKPCMAWSTFRPQRQGLMSFHVPQSPEIPRTCTSS